MEYFGADDKETPLPNDGEEGTETVMNNIRIIPKLKDLSSRNYYNKLETDIKYLKEQMSGMEVTINALKSDNNKLKRAMLKTMHNTTTTKAMNSTTEAAAGVISPDIKLATEPTREDVNATPTAVTEVYALQVEEADATQNSSIDTLDSSLDTDTQEVTKNNTIPGTIESQERVEDASPRASSVLKVRQDAASADQAQVQESSQQEPKIENKKIRVVVVADSHGRDLGKSIGCKLTNKYDVSVFVKPEKAIHESKSMRGCDWLVVMGGSNDIGKSPLSKIPEDVKLLLPVSRKCKLIINTIPRRQHHSEGTEQNLNKIMRLANFCIHETVNSSRDKCAKNIRLNFLDKKIASEHIKEDGMHLNANGKEILCKSIIHFLPITIRIKPPQMLTSLEKWLVPTNQPMVASTVIATEEKTFLDKWVKVMSKSARTRQ